MAQKMLHICDKCKSEDHDLEYQLEADNFYQFTFSFYPISSGPHMPGGSQKDFRNETYQICGQCKAAMLADIDSVIAPLKA
jgi:hypothetical protein